MIYADYAPIYDVIGQGAFAEALSRRIIGALPATPRRALDLACGTGAAALFMAAVGVEVVGVDRSPQMLEIARGRARDLSLAVTFVEADLRSLPVSAHLRPASFDLITCLYDSLNYLTGDNELELAVAGAARLLAPGGRLVFDLNTEAEYIAWDDVDQVVYDANGVLVYNRLSYDQARRIAHGRIVWFSREAERWWRGEETHIERAWTAAEVETALAKAGLALLARRTPLWEPAQPDALRVVYEAVQPYR